MPPNVASYYPNSICFEDKSKLSFLNNWFKKQYKNFIIMFQACKDSKLRETTYQSKKCASKDEVEKFFSENVFY